MSCFIIAVRQLPDWSVDRWYVLVKSLSYTSHLTNKHTNKRKENFLILRTIHLSKKNSLLRKTNLQSLLSIPIVGVSFRLLQSLRNL